MASSAETLTALEQRIAIDKFAKFKGAARVSFRHLEFPYPTRQIDNKVIQQLLRDFDGEGCIREEPSHRIPVVIDESILQTVLEKNSLTRGTFKAKADHPPILKLESEVKLECLHGQHRILAAKEHLAASHWWWVIDIYGTDLDKDTKQALREGYSYSAKYKSGDIFRHMRLCHYDNDPLGVQRWRGRLSSSQDKFVEHLLTKRPILIEALDSVLFIQGIWRDFYIGSLDVFLFPKIDEEIAHYIKFIKETLSYILDSSIATMMQTDPNTIYHIQSRSPALSKSDNRFIQMKFKELFPGIVDITIRAKISHRLLSTDVLIPSLYTLIKDIRYLKQLAELLTKLLPGSRKKTLRQRWFHCFGGSTLSDGAIEIQQGVSGPYNPISGAHPDSFDICYQQLWLCSYRVCKYPNAYGQLQVAELAQRLGFSTPMIDLEVGQEPALVVIEKAIREVYHTLRPNEKFEFDANRAKAVIFSFKRHINDLTSRPPTTTIAPRITVTGSGTPLLHRCGHSQLDTQDLEHLFLHKIHAPLSKYERDGDEVSSFYVKRSRHIAFFGGIDLNHEAISVYPMTNREEDTSRPAEELVRLIPTSEQQAQNIENVVENGQVVLHEGRMVRFMEKGTLQREVPFIKEIVNNCAKEYADQGKKLFIGGGAHFVWTDSFDILEQSKEYTIQIVTLVEPRLGKRRYNEDMPDKFHPARKTAFDHSMGG